MSLRAQPEKSLSDEFLRALREEIRSSAEAASDRHRTAPQRIRAARKGTKRARALLRLLRGTAPGVFRRENAWIRDSARKLSDLRDADALLEISQQLEGAVPDAAAAGALAQLRIELERWRDKVWPAPASMELELSRFSARLGQSGRRLAQSPLPPGEFGLFADDLRHAYRQARRAMKTAYAEGTAPAFHAWRKAVKRLGFLLRFLRCAWPGPLKEVGKTLREIGRLLGEDHDAAMLAEFLEQHPGSLPAPTKAHLLNTLRAHSLQLRRRAEPLGRRALALRPREFTRALECWWQAACRPAAGKAARGGTGQGI